MHIQSHGVKPSLYQDSTNNKSNSRGKNKVRGHLYKSYIYNTLKIVVFIWGNNIGTKIWWEYKIVKYNTFMRKKLQWGL